MPPSLRWESTRALRCAENVPPFCGRKPPYSIEFRKSDIEHNQVWLQFFCFLDCFHSLRSLAYDWQFLVWFEDRTDLPSPISKIINHHDPAWADCNFCQCRHCPRPLSIFEDVAAF
jgi:hypothetical protein